MNSASPAIPDRLAAALAGRYRFDRELGAGGMATVYLAEDVKHSRRVAIKVLKPELAAVIGGDRFLTEIKTTANLQHPHILPLFDSGEADSYLFYVMPFIEGESLRDRLDREKQLGVDEAVRIARDVADALDYAHRHGVIHRDIKPANILLHDGRPLVADFGIALAVSNAGGGRMTETGLSLGTPHYMSPEQASAERDLSARSDVYSLGCVLYEMLAGEPPHTGPNPAAILMRILTENPRSLSDIRPTVPMHVASAVAKAVEKLPADRFETARQFRDALEDPAFRFTRAPVVTATTTGVQTPSPASRRWDRRSIVLGGAAALFAASTLWFALQKPAAPSLPEGVMAFYVFDSLPNDLIGPVLGPRGGLAYTRNGELFVRPPGTARTSALEAARGNTGHVAFSPDGDWIVYSQPVNDGMMLRKLPTRGGNPVTLGTFKGVALAPFWGDDGWIYVTLGPGIWAVARVPENGGAPDTLLTGTRVPIHYAKVPGRPTLFFGYYSSSAADPGLYAIDLERRDTTSLIPGGYWPEWSPTGHLLYARNEGSLFAVTVSDNGKTVVGSPVPVLDSLAEALPEGRFDLSPAGALIYAAGQRFSSTTSNSYFLELDSINGGSERIPLPPSDHWDAKFSPDGRRLAYIRNDHLWIYDLDLGTHTQLTREGSRRHNPAWSLDGTRIAFSQAERENIDVFVLDVAGKTPPERVGGSDAADYPTQWLPDSSILVQTQDARSDILLVRKGDSVTALLQADWVERDGRVSPDGRWLAYISGEGGRADLYVRRWPGLENKVKVSAGDAPMANSSFALWSKDSRTLYYHQGQQLVAASVADARDSVRITSRRVIRDNLRGILADLHPDGRRLLVLAQGDAAADSIAARQRRSLVVITNWASGLRQRMAPATR